MRQKIKITNHASSKILSLRLSRVSRYTDSGWTIDTIKWKGLIGKGSVGRPTRRWADDIT